MAVGQSFASEQGFLEKCSTRVARNMALGSASGSRHVSDILSRTSSGLLTASLPYSGSTAFWHKVTMHPTRSGYTFSMKLSTQIICCIPIGAKHQANGILIRHPNYCTLHALKAKQSLSWPRKRISGQTMEAVSSSKSLPALHHIV